MSGEVKEYLEFEQGKEDIAIMKEDARLRRPLDYYRASVKVSKRGNEINIDGIFKSREEVMTALLNAIPDDLHTWFEVTIERFQLGKAYKTKMGNERSEENKPDNS